MRNITKKVEVSEYRCLIYDRELKVEKEVVKTKPSFEQEIELQEGEILLEKTLVKTEEVKYTMSPTTYFKHADIVKE